MLLRRPLAPAFLYSLFSVLLIQPASQRAANNSNARCIHLTQNQLCCFDIRFVEPIYPREARLAQIEGVAKLILVIGADHSIAELRAVSGDPVLGDASMRAVRQWRFLHLFGGFVGQPPKEIEVPLSFTFRIKDAPKPAYLHLANGRVIRADTVREFTDGIEYTVGQRTHRISANAVTEVNGCARITFGPLKDGACLPTGGPSFDIVAMPLLRANKGGRLGRSISQTDE
jgi:hypothetical protein